MLEQPEDLRRRLQAAWEKLVPGHPEIGVQLLERWNEPHRDYHGQSHLAYGLDRLEELGAAPLEYVALWFHDAVHHNDTPSDELASAVMARELLEGVLPPDQVEEVARLVLVTINHDPRPGDGAGARVSDADLAVLGTEPSDYARTVQSIRAEFSQLAEPEWDRGRIAFTGTLLNRPRLFLTPEGERLWEAAARRNLAHERDTRLAGDPSRIKDVL